MERRIFRKKSVERISSPDEINDYIHVTPPAVWAVLIALSVFLVGVLIWGVFGVIENKEPALATVENGKLNAVIDANYYDSIHVGQKINVEGRQLTITRKNGITSMREDTEKLNWDVEWEELKAYENGIYYDLPDYKYFSVQADAEGIPDGYYNATVNIEKLHPIELLLK